MNKICSGIVLASNINLQNLVNTVQSLSVWNILSLSVSLPKNTKRSSSNYTVLWTSGHCRFPATKHHRMHACCSLYTLHIQPFFCQFSQCKFQRSNHSSMACCMPRVLPTLTQCWFHTFSCCHEHGDGDGSPFRDTSLTLHSLPHHGASTPQHSLPLFLSLLLPPPLLLPLPPLQDLTPDATSNVRSLATHAESPAALFSLPSTPTSRLSSPAGDKNSVYRSGSATTAAGEMSAPSLSPPPSASSSAKPPRHQRLALRRNYRCCGFGRSFRNLGSRCRTRSREQHKRRRRGIQSVCSWAEEARCCWAWAWRTPERWEACGHLWWRGQGPKPGGDSGGDGDTCQWRCSSWTIWSWQGRRGRKEKEDRRRKGLCLSWHSNHNNHNHNQIIKAFTRIKNLLKGNWKREEEKEGINKIKGKHSMGMGWQSESANQTERKKRKGVFVSEYELESLMEQTVPGPTLDSAQIAFYLFLTSVG